MSGTAGPSTVHKFRSYCDLVLKWLGQGQLITQHAHHFKDFRHATCELICNKQGWSSDTVHTCMPSDYRLKPYHVQLPIQIFDIALPRQPPSALEVWLHILLTQPLPLVCRVWPLRASAAPCTLASTCWQSMSMHLTDTLVGGCTNTNCWVVEHDYIILE